MDIETVLIVDDESLMRDAINEMLENEAKKVLAAESGEEALEILMMEKIDVVITDLNMPGIDGFQLMQRAKAMDSSIAVVIMTGYSDLFSAEEAMKKGADEYILKPFKKDEITVLIERARRHASFVQKRHLTQERELMLKYIVAANKAIAASGYPSPDKERILALGHQLKQVIVNNLKQIQKDRR